MEANHNDVSRSHDWPAGVQEPTITIVICTRHRPALLRNCLEAVKRQRRSPDETLVIDNTSGDKETAAIVREHGALYILEPVPGLSRARNRGLADAKSEIVAYLDDDAVPDEDWLSNILLPFVDPNVGVVTGGTFESQSSSHENRRAPIRALSNNDQNWFEIAAYGGLGIGANMALRKSECSGWKVFDERLGRGAPLEGMEEHHAIVAFLARGCSAVHIPDAAVIHSSQYPRDVIREARNSMAYWMLLYSEYPSHRRELVRFLIRRIRQKPLTWQRDSPDPGDIITSRRWSLLKAWVAGTLLYIRCRKRQAE